jgi:tetrahydromethanopterin S-methyltransferase subunit B
MLFTNGFAELDAHTSQMVYAPGEPLFVYGTGEPNESIILRLYAPDNTVAEFQQIMTDPDGTFQHYIMDWAEPTANIPFGTYTLEVISNQQGGLLRTIDIKFSSTSELTNIPIERDIITTVFAPETTAVGNLFRVFVQTTSGGLLIGGEPSTILGTSHIHLPNGQVENLDEVLTTLHQGLYYVDYFPGLEGTYVFHMVAFNEGNISHGSAATNVLTQDISGISEQIIELNSVLDETAKELERLKTETTKFGSTLESASSNIDTSVTTISTSVENIEEGSSQLNALLFPIVSSIAIILALQIVIIARRR